MNPASDTLHGMALALVVGAAAACLAGEMPDNRPGRLAGFLPALAGMFAEAGADPASALRAAVRALADIEAEAASHDAV